MQACLYSCVQRLSLTAAAPGAGLCAPGPRSLSPGFFSQTALLIWPLCLLNVSIPWGILQSNSKLHSLKLGSRIISSLIFVVHKYIFTPIYHKNTNYQP